MNLLMTRRKLRTVLKRWMPVVRVAVAVIVLVQLVAIGLNPVLAVGSNYDASAKRNDD